MEWGYKQGQNFQIWVAFKALPVRFYYDQGVSTTLLAPSLRFTVFYAHIWKRSGNAAQWNGGIRDDILCERVANDQWKICIMDKNLDRTIKTILITDRGTLFSVPMFLTSSADKHTVYVLDLAKDCYGITIDGRIMFHYEDPNAECYRGLVIDSDGLIIGSCVDNKVQR